MDEMECFKLFMKTRVVSNNSAKIKDIYMNAENKQSKDFYENIIAIAYSETMIEKDMGGKLARYFNWNYDRIVNELGQYLVSCTV
jgi:hypothetical protein